MSLVGRVAGARAALVARAYPRAACAGGATAAVVALAVVALALLSLLAVAPARAESSARTTAASRAGGPIAVDGRLDEDSWRSAPVASGFWQRSPREGEPPQADTEFHVLYDDSAVYIGVRALDAEPPAIRGLLTRRDEESTSDWIAVGIDSFHDRRTAHVFAINPVGVKRDYVIFDDVELDASWNGVWSGASRIGDTGWSAEFRIPLSQLRYDAGANRTWGLQVSRVVGRTQEETVWSPTPTARSQLVSLYGTLEGLDGLAAPRRLELLPYALGGAGVETRQGDDALSAVGSAGLDVEYGLGSAIAITGALNPDFGQIEADPSVVNLTDVETFLVEKRPLFVDSGELFRLALPTGDSIKERLFYSRRVGAPPHVSQVAGVRAPDTTTIYGAAVLAGKSGPWSFGALDAVTAAETVEVPDVVDPGVPPAPGATRQVQVEPLTNYAVVYGQRQARRGRTRLGAGLTSVTRRLTAPAGDAGVDLRSLLHDQAVTGGLQLDHRFARDRWSARARAVGSYVHGSAEAIALTQQASQRYYQRPDAAHLEFDPARTSLTGAGLLWSVGQDADDRFRWGALGDLRSPGLAFNDAGFQIVADRLSHWGWAQLRDTRPGDTLLAYEIETQQWLHLDWEPRLKEYGARLGADLTFTNYWRLFGGVGVSRHVWDTRYLRGGPALRRDAELWGWYLANTDQRRAVRAAVDGDWGFIPRTGTWWLVARPQIVVQARSNFDIGFGLELVRNVNVDQFVETTPDATGELQHILGHLRQSTVGVTLRANYTFTPELSLQLYAQPFISAGAFDDYEVVVDPGARAYRDRVHVFAPDELTDMGDRVAVDRDGDGAPEYSFGRADFNVRELRANLVLRWEYRPGSTLFVVWRRDRGSFAPGSAGPGRLALGDELPDVFRGEGTDVVVVKLSYYL